jgi:hypothetical protein
MLLRALLSLRWKVGVIEHALWTARVVVPLPAPAMINGHFMGFATDRDALRRARILKAVVAQQAEEISGDWSIRLRQNEVSIRAQSGLQNVQQRVKIGTFIEHI